ncbi:hypothetical protein APHAL10511_004280 [Amanita phalloides]|nr:hypothetical protein APHAL10511_004280 [Amanita phalloides]
MPSSRSSFADSPSSSPSSSRVSLVHQDEDDETITAPCALTATKLRKQNNSQDDSDLRLLAISTHMTELSYAISDIQTRIFEIQELRHRSQSSGDAANTTSIIDQSLMNLNERLESVEKGVKTINEALEPMKSRTCKANALSSKLGETTIILRKQSALIAEWEAVRDESDVLREELKEDKWLTVFRTVTDQADGMMSSLEKAVNRCQEFIWQVHKRGAADSQTHLHSPLSISRADHRIISLDVFSSLLGSYEAKKKHYMPATSKVLSIIDKGVRDRVTKNGETLRRHAESAQRWKNLRERISRTDTDMEMVRKLLTNADAVSSDAGSSTVSLKNSFGTPESESKPKSSSSKTLARSISPFRKIARKIARSARQSPSRVTPPQLPPVTPLTINKNNAPRSPVSEPPPVTRTLLRQRSSILVDQAGNSQTPPRLGHKHSHSLETDSSIKVDVLKGRPQTTKQRWNNSTKLESEERTLTVKGTPTRRAPSVLGSYSQGNNVPPVPLVSTPYRRSLSRASMASSRPWSPITSSGSTSMSSTHPPLMPIFRPPSRAQTPAHAMASTIAATPRSRPKAPSYIPTPAKRSISAPYHSLDDDNLSPKSRPFSPSLSGSGASPNSPSQAFVRPPSRSMIPIPSLHLSSMSRPSTSLSNYDQPESPSASAFKTAAARAQTPETILCEKLQHVTVHHGSVGPRSSMRPLSRAPPSSYKDGTPSRVSSRPASRSGSFTPSLDGLPLHEYTVGNVKDPLDVEVATIVNSIPHSLLITRVDPPLRKVPREGEEIKAQYAFSNALSKKIVTCRLTTMTRSGKTGDMTTKKVMCRVGGGWQDLSHYILNRQAGI